MSVSRIAETIRLKHAPVALHWSDDKPENAVQFEKGGWGCVMFLVVAAAKGKTGALDRDTCGCYRSVRHVPGDGGERRGKFHDKIAMEESDIYCMNGVVV